MDLKCQHELILYLKNWSKDHKHSVIGVFHDINHAMELADHLLVLEKGHIKALGKAEEIIKSGLLNDVYEMDIKKYMLNSLKKWEFVN